MSSVETKLYAEAKEQFVNKRTMQEVQIKQLAEIVEPIRATVLRDLSIPEPLTLQTLIPELYKDKVDVEVYRQQFQEARELIARIRDAIVTVNAEAVAHLTEYCKVDISSLSTDAEKLQHIRDSFIAQRAKQEAQVLELSSKLAKVNPAILEGVGLPADMTLKSLIPGYYAAEMNEQECREQYEQTVEMLNRLKEVVRSKNEEVRKCLQEYVVLTSGQA